MAPQTHLVRTKECMGVNTSVRPGRPEKVREKSGDSGNFEIRSAGHVGKPPANVLFQENRRVPNRGREGKTSGSRNTMVRRAKTHPAQLLPDRTHCSAANQFLKSPIEVVPTNSEVSPDLRPSSSNNPSGENDPRIQTVHRSARRVEARGKRRLAAIVYTIAASCRSVPPQGLEQRDLLIKSRFFEAKRGRNEGESWRNVRRFLPIDLLRLSRFAFGSGAGCGDSEKRLPL